MPVARICRLFAVLFCLWPLASNAEDLKTNRVGFVSAGPKAEAAVSLDALRKGLHDLGYEEGKNLEIAQKYADGVPERLPKLMDELAKAKVSVIVTSSVASALAAKKAGSSIPVVVVAASDFVGNGLVDTVEHPGGNITGIDEDVPGLSTVRLELLKEAVHIKSPVAVLSGATGPTHEKLMADSEHAAHVLGVELKTFKIEGAKENGKETSKEAGKETGKEIDAAFDSIAKAQPTAILVFSGALTDVHSKQIVELATKYKLPGMYWQARFAEEGGLMYYGPKLSGAFEQSAILVDRILKGASAGDLPVLYAKEFELVINLKAAKELGITIPQPILSRANRVIQ
jgi:putative tryptophan/tyrosine transport system substrate-binding protein